MRQALLLATIPAAFGLGLLVDRLVPAAEAQAPAAQPMIIDLAALTNGDIGNIVPGLGTIRTRTLLALPQGTMSVATGNAPKHTHADANEFQYVVSGTGTVWLGDQQRPIHPGDLIIIPKGTVHGGSVPAAGEEIKIFAIKMPPQAPDDFHPVP